MSGNGNRFLCGMRRFDKHKIQSTSPDNKELHNENEKRLSELIKLRNQQDQGIFQASIPSVTVDNTTINDHKWSQEIPINRGKN